MDILVALYKELFLWCSSGRKVTATLLCPPHLEAQQSTWARARVYIVLGAGWGQKASGTLFRAAFHSRTTGVTLMNEALRETHTLSKPHNLEGLFG